MGIGAVSCLIFYITGLFGFQFVGIVLLLVGLPLSIYREYLHISIDPETSIITTITQRYFISQKLTCAFDGCRITYGLQYVAHRTTAMVLEVKTASGFSLFRLIENPMAGLHQYDLKKIVKCIERSGNRVEFKDKVSSFF